MQKNHPFGDGGRNPSARTELNTATGNVAKSLLARTHRMDMDRQAMQNVERWMRGLGISHSPNGRAAAAVRMSSGQNKALDYSSPVLAAIKTQEDMLQALLQKSLQVVKSSAAVRMTEVAHGQWVSIITSEIRHMSAAEDIDTLLRCLQLAGEIGAENTNDFLGKHLARTENWFQNSLEFSRGLMDQLPRELITWENGSVLMNVLQRYGKNLVTAHDRLLSHFASLVECSGIAEGMAQQIGGQNESAHAQQARSAISGIRRAGAEMMYPSGGQAEGRLFKLQGPMQLLLKNRNRWAAWAMQQDRALTDYKKTSCR